jgi:predicted nucleotidyltransferase
MVNSKYILSEIKRLVVEKASDAKVYLYGSRARGTANKESDWDLLILLNKERITPEIEEEITFSLYDLEFETGEVISPMVYSEKEWNTKYKITSFYHIVMQEAKLL